MSERMPNGATKCPNLQTNQIGKVSWLTRGQEKSAGPRALDQPSNMSHEPATNNSRSPRWDLLAEEPLDPIGPHNLGDVRVPSVK